MMPIFDRPRDFPTRFNIDLVTVGEERSEFEKELLLEDERIAIHSGKLGDIIYALPTVRALGVNHLVLNAFHSLNDRLRDFPLLLARQMVPLLLNQNYLRKISITQGNIPLEECWNAISGIDYNLDAFRNVPRHHVDYRYPLNDEVFRYTSDKAPLHLAQAFGAAQGLRINLEEKWLDAPPKPEAKDHVVISITSNWRSYPSWFWGALLKGIPKLLFVGSETEWNRAGIAHARFVKTENHLELASWIAGCRLFVGTVSFPYALAEGLKVPRLVELCYRQLNAFPVGANGNFLPPNIFRARKLIEDLLPHGDAEIYRRVTRQMRYSLTLRGRMNRLLLQLRSQTLAENAYRTFRSALGRLRLHHRWSSFLRKS